MYGLYSGLPTGCMVAGSIVYGWSLGGRCGHSSRRSMTVCFGGGLLSRLWYGAWLFEAQYDIACSGLAVGTGVGSGSVYVGVGTVPPGGNGFVIAFGPST